MQGCLKKRGRGGVGAGKFLRRALGDNPAALRTGFGTDLEDPVGGFEDVEIVLDDDDAVSTVHDALQHGEQAFHIVAMQPGRGLIEEEQGALVGGRRLGGEVTEIADQLEALGLAAGEGVERLAERQVTKTDLVERGEPAVDLRV